MLVQIFLFIFAVILAATTALSYLMLGETARERHVRLQIFTVVGAIVALLAVLSALHARETVNLIWLFGSEFIDGGLVEHGTALFFALCCCLGAAIAWRDETSSRLIYLGLAVACFLIAGEEVSWGQWFFHWQTPDALSQVNLQNETNLHNIINPRAYDPIYSLAGFSLIGFAVMSVMLDARDWVGTRSNVFIYRDVSLFMDWLAESRFGMVLALSTAVLLQHESFEEYSEALLALTLMLFLMFRLAATDIVARHETMAAE